MTDVAAAIGLVQLRRLPRWLEQRRYKAAYFDQHLERVQTPRTAPNTTHAYHQYTVRVPPGVDRGAVLQRLNERGVGARVYYPLPIHRQPLFQARGEYLDVHLPETEKAAREVLSLPVHPALTETERSYIVEEVNSTCSK